MAQSPRLAQVFVELADTLVDQFDLVDFLHTLTDRSVELLGVQAAGLMIADQRGDLQVLASSSEAARLLEVFELQNSEGPCYDCFHGGEPVVNVALDDVRERWPRFQAAASEAGFRSAHALPMRLRGRMVGAINLFCTDRLTLDADDQAVGQGLADVATIGLLQERAVREHEVLAEQLQTALNSRVLIEQAKGMLAERGGMSTQEAFSMMRAHARSSGLLLSAAAAGVIDGSIDAGVLVARGDASRR